MSAFEYASPQSVEEALTILSSHPQARPLAGGQKMLLERNRDLPKDTILVDLGRIPSLKKIGQQDGTLRIGATATLNEISSNDLIRKHFPILAETAGLIGDAQLRNRATIGGNLAEGDPEYDLPAILLALGARFESERSRGGRELTAEDFFGKQAGGAPAPSELITSVLIPIAADNSGTAYVRFKHPARLTAVCGVAAAITVDRGRIVAAKIGITGATKHPTRLEALERALLNGPANNGQHASETVVLDDSVGPRGDAFASPEYRLHLARILTGRAVKQALGRINS